MRKLFLLLVLALIGTNAMAKKNDKMQLLEKSFKELKQSPADSIKQRNYFNAFPANFPDLLVCLGYTSFSEPMANSADYVTAFKNLNCISDEEKMTRLSHIMIGGFYQVDGVNLTRCIMKDLMRKDSDRAFSVISKLTNCQQILFWQCYWENPCEDPSLEQDFKLFYSTSGYNKERQVMKETYETFKGELPL